MSNWPIHDRTCFRFWASFGQETVIQLTGQITLVTVSGWGPSILEAHVAGSFALARRGSRPSLRLLPGHCPLAESPPDFVALIRLRRDDRMAEGARLEGVHTGNRIADSNPTFSAGQVYFHGFQ